MHTDAAEREAEQLAPRMLETRRDMRGGGDVREPQSAVSAARAPDAAATGATASAAPEASRSARAPPRGSAAPRAPPTNGPASGPGPIRGPPGRRLRTSRAPDRRLGRGRELSRAETAGFSEALDCDLGPVRLHVGPYAYALAEQRRAAALTYGTHIVLGRQAARAGPAALETVLAHELIHVVQQSAEPLPPRRGLHPPARAPPVLPLQRSPLRHQNIDLVPDWAEDAASAVGGAVSDAGSYVYDGAAYAGGELYDAGAAVASGVADLAIEVGGVVLEGAEAIVDYFAPGLLDFLRGDFLEDLAEWFCSGVDSLVSRLLDPLAEIDVMSAIEATFQGLAATVRAVYAGLGAGVSQAVGVILSPLLWVVEHFGDDIIGLIQGLSDGVGGIFTALWDNIAAPVLDFLGDVGGEVWEAFSAIAGWIWRGCVAIKDAAQWAFDWVLEQFGLTWEGEDGVAAWIEEKAQAAWDAFLRVIEPIKEPLMVVGAILVLLSPLGPIVVLSQVLPPIWEKLTWLVTNWRDLEVVVWARETLEKDILPAIIGAVETVKGVIMTAAAWLAGIVAAVARTVAAVISAFSSNTCLQSVSRVLNHVADQFQRMQAWAAGGFAGLNEAVGAVFDAIRAIFQPILDFLIRLAVVALNPPMLPLAITAAIWLLLPDPYKPPVITFVIDLLLAVSNLLAIALAPLGPMIFVVKAAAVGFLRRIRSGEGMTDDSRVAASNKVATIMAGGGPAFVGGYAIGLLQGLIDGIIDPFKLLFMMFELVVTGLKVLARVLDPYIQEIAPEAVIEGRDAFNAALATPVAAVTSGAERPEAAVGEARAPPAEDAAGASRTIESTLTAGRSVAGTGESAGGESAEASPAADVAAEAGAPTALGEAAAVSGEGEGLDLFAEGMPSDDTIARSISPGTISAVAGAGTEEVSAEGLESEMHAEVEEQGTTVSGLASLLGGAWDYLMQQAGRLGRYLAGKFMEYFALADFALGRKIGWLAGMILLEVLITYFTAGGYAVIKEGASIGRWLLAYLLRFLDIGGEILGVLGRALAPLKGPIMRGFGAARNFLSRFSFMRGLMGRIDNFIQTLFRFGDEAAAAGSHASAGRAAADAAPAPRLPEAPAAPARAPDAPARAPVARGRAPDAPRAGRAASETADEAGDRVAREVMDDPPTRPASEAAEELPDGTVRAVDEPGRPRVQDDAAKAAQFAEARIAARTIAEINDGLNTPVPITLGLLMALKRRYRWIDTFEAEPRSIGHYRIYMIASRDEVDNDYTPGGRPQTERAPGSPQSGSLPEPSPVRAGPFDDLTETQQRRLQELADEFGFDPNDPAVRELIDRTDPDTALRMLEDHGRRAAGPPAAGEVDSLDDLADQGISVRDRPPGTTGGSTSRQRAAPRENKIAGDVTEARHNVELGGSPGNARDILPGRTFDDWQERFASGEISFDEFAGAFPDGAEQLPLRVLDEQTGRVTTRYVDRMYHEGGNVVLRESKGVAELPLDQVSSRLRSQVDRDLWFARRNPGVIVEWRIDATALTDEQREILRLLVAENPGIFRVSPASILQ